MDKREESFVAAVEFARRGLLLNPEYYSDARRLELDIFQNMWIGASPDNCTEIEYVATHEFAHEIEIWITSQKTVVDLNGDIGELNVVFDKWLLSQNLNNALSLRGKENYTEYFAEAFASHYHTEKPSQIAEEVYGIVTSVFQQIRTIAR
jgi:hypothetical protein